MAVSVRGQVEVLRPSLEEVTQLGGVGIVKVVSLVTFEKLIFEGKRVRVRGKPAYSAKLLVLASRTPSRLWTSDLFWSNCTKLELLITPHRTLLGLFVANLAWL